jgi:tyrosinase
MALCVAAISAGALWTQRSPAHAGGGTVALRMRVNVKDLTAQQRRDFVQAILKLKRTPSPYDPRLSYYNQFVAWHVRAMRCDVDAAHMRPSFLPWHREFLLLFEDALRQVSG